MKRILTAALALFLLGAGAAMAQDRHDDHRGDGGGYRGQDNRGNDHRGNDHRGDDRRGGYGGGGRHWNQGQRLDNRYGAYAPVNDWRSRRLPPPRRGYHWVRSGDDYVQAALVGGLIASVIAASR